MRAQTASLIAVLLASPLAAAGPKILLCVDDGGDGSGFDIQTGLKQTGLFDAVDLVDCSINTPSLNQLKGYQGVLAFDNFGYADPTTLGNNLADYVDAGGGVVSMQFNLDSNFFTNILGRWETGGYDCILPNNTDFNFATFTNTPKDPNSPLVQGVVSIGSDLHSDGVLNKAKGAISVWDYDNGMVGVCQMAVNGALRVDLNFYPGTQLYQEGKAGDGIRLMTNALAAVAGGLNPLKGMPNPAMFPDTGTGAISAPVTITYTNTDKNAQTVTGFTIGGANAGDFVLVKAPQLPSTVGSMQTISVQLAFQPTVAGMLKAKLSAAVNGQMSTADVDLVGNALPSQLVVMPTPVVVGGSLIGVPITKDVTIANQGNGIVKVLSATVTQDAAEFTISGGPMLPVALGPGGSFAITVKMTPQQNGKLAGTLTITSDDMSTPTINTPLTGCAGPASISVDAASVILGGVNLGASTMHTVNVTNAGCQDLHVTALNLGGTNAGDYAVDGGKSLPGTLAADQSAPFNVTFTPTQLGPRSATVTVVSDDPMSPQKVVSFQGTGTMSSVAVDPMMLDFGMVKAGATSAAQTFNVTNGGNGTLKVQQIVFSDPAFAQSNMPKPPFSVGPMGSQPVGVTCTPSDMGAINATATVMTDVGNATVNLTCTGIAPRLQVTPNPIDFGQVPVSMQSSMLAVTFKNVGTDDLEIDSILPGGLDGNDFFSNDSPATPLTITPNQSITFHMVFSPSNSGVEQAELDVSDNEPVNNMPVIPMTGQGVQAGIKVMPMTLDFGAVMTNTKSAAKAVTIMNTGDVDVTLDSVKITGPNAALFAVDNMGPITIPTAGSAMVNVTFEPVVPGSVKNAALTMTSKMFAPLSVPLSGTGTTLGLMVTPSGIDFGMVAVGDTSAPTTVTIKNINSVPIAIASITSTDSAFAVDTSKSTLMLPAGMSTTFDVAFKPGVTGPKTAVLNLTLNGQTKPLSTVQVAGIGVDKADNNMPGGCSCAVGAGGRRVPPALALVAAALALVLARRRRARR